LARRREVLRGLYGTSIVAAIGGACGPARAAPSPSPRKYRIGLLIQRVPQYVVPSEWEMNGPVAIKTVQTRPPNCDVCAIETGILDALEKRGYRQGGNLEWIIATPSDYGATGAADLLPAARALVALGVEMIITLINDATIAAAQATTTLPIVAQVNDIVETGVVSNLAHPGGNVTGSSGSVADVTLKRLELLKETFPQVKRPILVYGNFATHLRAVTTALQAANQLGLSMVPMLLTGDGSDVVSKTNAALGAGADSLVEVGINPGAPEVFPLAKERRLPSVVGPQHIDAGGLVALGFIRDHAQIADYVDRILNGQKPGDLPIVAPSGLELIVNLKAAESFGLTIAPSVLARATKVIQ
jgi:putative ABC transport system substrate-binding protein